MHDLNTIKNMNAETFKPGDRVRVRDDIILEEFRGHTGRVLLDDGTENLPIKVAFDEGSGGSANAYFERVELERLPPLNPEKDAREIAQLVLDAHAIKPFWQRSGFQIRELIAEGILRAQGEYKEDE